MLQAKLVGHVLRKGIQAGACIGALVAFPLQTLVLKRAPFTMHHLVNTTGLSSMVGLVLSGVAIAGKSTQIKEREGWEDRVYRLHYNRGQNRVDNWSSIGAGVGLGLGVNYRLGDGLDRGFLGLKVLPASLVGAMALGTAAGVLVHLAVPMSSKDK